MQYEYEIYWTFRQNDRSPVSDRVVIARDATLAGAMKKLAEARRNNVFWVGSENVGLIVPVTNNGHAPYAVTAAYLAAYGQKLLARRLDADGIVRSAHRADVYGLNLLKRTLALEYGG